MHSPETHLVPGGYLQGILVPQWPAPPEVHALCSTRLGGVSASPWNSLNLGEHVGDDPKAVIRNRALWADRLQVRPVFMQQVHGTSVLCLDGPTANGAEGDACYTTRPGQACTMMVADCLPVLLCDARGGAHARIGAAHAGWRGLSGLSSRQGQGVLEALAAHFDPEHTLAWLGPSIGPQAFEVGADVKQAFERAHPACEARFQSLPASAEVMSGPAVPKWLADLPGLARDRLAALGITQIYGNDGSPAWCTVANASLFFSHRRDRVSGRLATSIWLA
ncbi:MAG: peptidoglycan editing factor PgeF [Ramlibacter sp.]|uniref:peptidoglycan editing factor PgeF n=1 Tax=Ramlibacter sp. TaxID=1917967 RepID=UPI002639DE5E|nr:peptidoglycan editing factor PgeF [Ramlibacter sp.]MDH4375404.1 peptidoglycan editing factor PgeF [Ramlibacter sp.]